MTQLNSLEPAKPRGARGITAIGQIVTHKSFSKLTLLGLAAFGIAAVSNGVKSNNYWNQTIFAVQTVVLITQHEQARAELKRSQKAKEQAIAKYESQLAEQERQQQQSRSEAREQIQERELAINALRQEISTQERTNHEMVGILEQQESEARRQIEMLNQKIAASIEERDRVQQHFRQLEQKNAGELAAAHALIEEAHRVEEKVRQIKAENKQLTWDLETAKERIRHLHKTAENYKARLSRYENQLFEEIDTSRATLAFSPNAINQLFDLSQNDFQKHQKVLKTLKQMTTDLRHPGLQTHKYSNADGEEIFEAYVENRTPSAWRIFWYYGAEDNFLTIDAIAPHP